jgi:Ribosomal RNA adenine dimethylase
MTHSDREIAALADPKLGQHFLVSPGKLSAIVAAADIRGTDDVLELGAGVGTVAREFPQCRSLTLVELDERFIGLLREKVPHARVLQGDALTIVRAVSVDVLIGNLPHAVTASLLKLLPSLSFRTAVLAVAESANLDSLGAGFSWSEVARVAGDDFLPPQPSVSRIVKVVPLAEDGDHGPAQFRDG